MRRRDVAILALSIVSVYFALQQEGSFTFVPGWVHLVEADTSHLGSPEHLPPPVPADLNGDGTREVIVATRDAKLQVLSPPKTHSATGDFALATVVAEVSLLPANIRIAAGRKPVALAVGFLDPPPPVSTRNQLRKQVVVAVTMDWTVMCFNHNLKLLWEYNLQHDFPHHSSVREVAVLVTNHTVNQGDRGMVVVGGSVELGDLATPMDPFQQEMLAEAREAERRHGASDQDRMEQAAGIGAGGGDRVDRSRHFNYYAFDGQRGELRWKHESGDFHRDPESATHTTTPQHNYKLDAASLNTRHFGEHECRDYRRSVIEALPHAWGTRDDTVFRLAHFTTAPKRKPEGSGGKGSGGGATGSNPLVGAVESVMAAAAGSRPGTKRKYMLEPNVLVAHLKEGLEVVHLFTGRTLCKLHLPENGLHADINGDGLVDHVQAHGWHPHEHQFGGAERIPRCWATAMTGVPAREQLFNGSICRSSSAASTFDGSMHASRRNRVHEETFSPLEVALPTLLPRHDGYVARSPTHGAKKRRGAAADAVFLNSRGEVTAYSADGFRRWQVNAQTTWQRGGYDGHTAVAPTLLTFAPRVGGRASAVLAAGATLAHVISPQGKKLIKLELPDVPTVPLRAVDLNGDGLTDLLVQVSGGVFAYLQRTRAGAGPSATLLGVLIVAMAVVYFTQQVPGSKHAKPLRSTD